MNCVLRGWKMQSWGFNFRGQDFEGLKSRLTWIGYKCRWEKFQNINFQENQYFQSTCKDHWRSFWWRSKSAEFAKLHTFCLWSGSGINEAFETKEILGWRRFCDKGNRQSCINRTKSIRSEQFVVFSRFLGSQFCQNSFVQSLSRF